RIAASVEPPMPVPMMATSYCCVIKFSPKLQRSVCHRETEFLGETRFLGWRRLLPSSENQNNRNQKSRIIGSGHTENR
ncbi:MAG: hypothetical protein KDE01_03220, partial [Caldilineaceae bacterium]|nr:hypothetical protein [Caldilineaceae bacterium]